MPKPSAMLERIELKYATMYRAKFMHQCDTLAQMCKDAACIAANDVLKMGPGRAKAFCEQFDAVYNEMLRMAKDDADGGDETIEYARAKLDERLKAVIGSENFQSFEERYGWEE